MTFDEAFRTVIGHEGGFQNDPADRGNWTGGAIGKGSLVGTKYGVSAASYPGEDIRGMTLERAKEIYLRDFWGPAGCDIVPHVVKSPLFSIAIHTSAPRRPITAIKMLQRAAGVDDDGDIGPVTVGAISSMEPNRLAARLQGHYLDYLNNNVDQWQRYGRGWAQRVAEYLMET